MNTTVLGLVVVAALIIGGGAWYFLSDTDPESSPVVESRDASAEQLASTESSLNSLMGRNENVTCSGTHTTEAGESTGKVYVMNGKMRADFVTDSTALGGESVSSHMINDGEWMYIWSDMSPQGMKMIVPESTPQGDLLASESLDEWNTFAFAGAYDCIPWTVDVSVFSVPDSVSFLELGGAIPTVVNPPVF